MELQNVADRIRGVIERKPLEVTAYQDLFSVAREIAKTDVKLATKQCTWISDRLESAIPSLVGQNVEGARRMASLHREVLLEAAPYDFDSYLLYVEMNREARRKFYPPRRKVLRPVVNELQRLADASMVWNPATIRLVANGVTNNNIVVDGVKAFILPSSTAGSTKKFKLTVDDSGVLTATEVTT